MISNNVKMIQGGQTFLSVTGAKRSGIITRFTFTSLFLSVFIVFLFTGCGEVEEIVVVSESSEEIIPLAVGNFWVYEVRHFYYPDSSIILPSETWSVDSVVFWNGDPWFRMCIKSDTEQHRYFRNTQQGFEELFINIDDAGLIFKYPVDSSEYWRVPKKNIIIRVYDTDVDAGAFAGTISGCVYYIQMDEFVNAGRNYERSYIKPGIGRVHFGQYSDNIERDGIINYYMREYHLECN